AGDKADGARPLGRGSPEEEWSAERSSTRVACWLFRMRTRVQAKNTALRTRRASVLRCSHAEEYRGLGPLRLGRAAADFLSRQLAQNVGMPLAVSGKINDFGCDCLPDIVAAIADAQSDADCFKREAHHADRVLVELFTIQKGPDRHRHLPPRAYPRAR